MRSDEFRNESHAAATVGFAAQPQIGSLLHFLIAFVAFGDPASVLTLNESCVRHLVARWERLNGCAWQSPLYACAAAHLVCWSHGLRLLKHGAATFAADVGARKF